MNIKEVAKKYELSEATIRYYEKVGLIPPVHRNSVGYRDFTQEDENWINFSKCMRMSGMSVESLAEYISLFGKGDSTVARRKEILEEQQALIKSKLDDMQNTYDRISMKIDTYDEHLAKFEKELENQKENV
ncbi:MerR family transcriptional regulator [Companilactobacillus jidongensis]|uniref:MerR family transcriptional regulator n=1 Tax=Companilactobacillus jidongensis TaxID=2486006 RepID=UPI000F7A4A00|nr:MerR family transcriptional regulator [Companilactobacillus jidongensis]